MDRVSVGDEVVEYSDRGTGEPLLLVHAGAFSDWFAPMEADPQLAGFRVIRTRRAGYVQRAPGARHLSLSDHAAHCALLLDQLGIRTAHFCGHSSSALIGLQLALDRPGLVHSLILLEPAPGGDLIGPVTRAVLPENVGPAMGAYAEGRVEDGFDLFMRAVGGGGYLETLEASLGPEGHARAVRESAYFPDEAAAVMEWVFGPAEAAQITAPMLLVEGELTADVAAIPPESVGVLARLVPHAERAVLPSTSHLMPLEDPRAVAALVAGFARRHPIAGTPPGRSNHRGDVRS